MMFSGRTVSPERALDLLDRAKALREASDGALLVTVMNDTAAEHLPVDVLRAIITFQAVAQRLEEIANASIRGAPN
jgi:hypothetical protein